MPLIDLLKNNPNFPYYYRGKGNFSQKSLKYGSDTPGGGDSGQPYITDPEGRITVRAGDDGFVRGGALGAAKSAAKDTLRIQKFLEDRPKGTLFIARQVGLQLSNPRLEVKKGAQGIIEGIFDADLGPITGGLLQPTRLYNLGINTLAQVPANIIGTHFNRHGLLPVQTDGSKYLSVVKFNNNSDNSKYNRLVLLRNKLNVANDQTPRLKDSRFTQAIGSILGFTVGQNNIDSYIGGPGSTYGLGFTDIPRYDFTNRNNSKIKQPSFEKGKINYFDTLKISKQYNIDSIYTLQVNNRLAAIRSNINLDQPTTKPTQIDQVVIKYDNNNPAGSNGTSDSPTLRDYKNLISQIDDTNTKYIKTLPTGSTPQSLTASFIDRQDATNVVNKTYRYYGGYDEKGNKKYVDTTTKDETQGIDYTNRNQFSRKDADILSVVFRAIPPFGTIATDINDLQYRYVFSAYMKGFKDNFTGTWNETNYAGRSESFYIYNKFKRDVSFNLDIPCFNRQQLFEKHRALGQLAATTAGAYNAKGILGGVLLKVNIGNYLKGEFAILNSLSYDIPDDASWDTDDTALLAMYLKASFSLTIIHKEEAAQYKPDGGFFKHLPDDFKSFLPTISEGRLAKFIKD